MEKETMKNASCQSPEFRPLKALHQCITDLLTIEAIDAEACRKLKEKLCAHTFNILVVGQFNRGKTSLINALIGEALLPVGVIPLTSVVTVLSYGEKSAIKVWFQDGHCAETTPECLGEYVTEKGNPHNVKGVREVNVSHPSSWLKDGIRLLDTPGIDSVYSHNTDMAYRYLPQADAVRFLLSADQPVSRAELDFLRDVREYAERIFFLLNKADHLSETELREAVTFTRTAIAEAMGREPFIAPVSARQALEGKLAGSPELVEKSLLPPFSTTLHTFLQKDKGAVLIGSAVRNLQRIISQARFRCDLELSSLKTPLGELQEKIRAFESKKQEVLLAREEYGILLEGESKRLLQKSVEPDLASFKTELVQQITFIVERCFNERQALPARQLSEALEQEAIGEIRESFDAWRSREDEKVGREFEALCSRFTTRINDTVDELFNFSAELFAIPFAPVQADSLWAVESGFYYKFRSEPVGLKIFTSSVLLALPGFISHRLILKQMKEYVGETVEMQSGRVRHDFAVRLDKSVQGFRREMLRRIEATIEGIEAALKKGVKQRQAGENEFSTRGQALLEAAAKLDQIGERVMETINRGN